MARPNTEQIVKRKIVGQFQGWGIRTIINLQTPGEHASCGVSLEESGFTYDPNVFMTNDSEQLLPTYDMRQNYRSQCVFFFCFFVIFTVYYYNFAWKDYGDATLDKLLDMVKVVAFAVQEGRVAIHCHAGEFVFFFFF